MTFRDVAGVPNRDEHPHDGGDISGLAPYIRIKKSQILDFEVTEAEITDLDHTDADAFHDDVSGEIAAVTAKTSPVAADLVLIEDSAASNAKKSVQIGNILALAGVWESFTPSFEGWSDFDGTIAARYTQIGKTVFARYHITVGTDTSPTGTVGLDLPVAATTTAYGGLIESHYGSIVWRDVGTGTIPGWALLNDANHFGFAYLTGASAPFAMLRWSDSQAPFTVAAGDQVHAELMYEAA